MITAVVHTPADDGFHPISWRPLRTRRLAWHKWLFGLQSRVGFSHYATFWKNETPGTPCAHCRSRHNQSVHGFLAHCQVCHPLVAARLAAWPTPNVIASWRATAVRSDLRILARLAVPLSLYCFHVCHHGGSRATRKMIGAFQTRVVDRVTEALSTATPPPRPMRTNPFLVADWH